MTCSDSRSLAGKVVIVTGAAQGIGRVYAREIARDGGIVIVADVNVQGGESVVKEIEHGGGAASFVALDVSDPSSCHALASAVVEEHGRVDGLVNNAAIFSTIQMKPFWEIETAEWDRLMAVNLKGPWLLTSALVEGLRASDSASVVNISSDAVWLGRPGYLHYVASKAGVAGMTHSMAHELGDYNVRVNTVSPGPIYTEIDRATVSPEQKATMLARQSLHREGHPEDMFGIVMFLLADSSSYVTGQTFHVNGGMLHP